MKKIQKIQKNQKIQKKQKVWKNPKGGPKGQKEARPELLVFGNTYFDCDVQQLRCIERPLIATPSMYWRRSNGLDF